MVGRKLRVVQRTKEGDLERSSSRIEPESRWICAAAAAAAAAAGYSIVGVFMSAGLNIYILHTESSLIKRWRRIEREREKHKLLRCNRNAPRKTEEKVNLAWPSALA